MRVRSTVGAGDSTLAGFLAGGGRGRSALVTAIAYGTAAVQLPGSVMPRPSDLNLDAALGVGGVEQRYDGASLRPADQQPLRGSGVEVGIDPGAGAELGTLGVHDDAINPIFCGFPVR